MCAGADSIQNMSILRHRPVGMAFDYRYGPLVLSNSCGRSRSVRSVNLTRVVSRFPAALAAQTPLLAGAGDLALVDLNDTLIEAHCHKRQGASFG